MFKIASLTNRSLESFKTTETADQITGRFKKYLPLQKGNEKVHKSVLAFNLLPVVTCPCDCKGCYDKKSLRQSSVRLKRIANTELAINHLDDLEKRIIKQIKNSRSVTAVRIHVGGDFFSRQYVDLWCRIRAEFPALPFYTYTKTQYGPELKKAGINVVESILPDGRINFAPLSEIRQMAKETGYPICPATLKNVATGYCGSRCKLCQKKQHVLFVKH